MKKTGIISTVTLILCFALTSNLFSQKTITKFIQINANTDLLGNITMSSIEKLPKLKKDATDTLINYKQIENIIGKSKNAINAINLLSNEGWLLVSTVAIGKDDYGRPNTPIIAYYFKKDY